MHLWKERILFSSSAQAIPPLSIQKIRHGDVREGMLSSGCHELLCAPTVDLCNEEMEHRIEFFNNRQFFLHRIVCKIFHRTTFSVTQMTLSCLQAKSTIYSKTFIFSPSFQGVFAILVYRLFCRLSFPLEQIHCLPSPWSIHLPQQYIHHCPWGTIITRICSLPHSLPLQLA